MTTNTTTEQRAAIIANMRDQLAESATEWDALAERLQGLYIAVDDLGRVRWTLPHGGWLAAQCNTAGRPLGLALTQDVADAAVMTTATDRDTLIGKCPGLSIVEAGAHFAAEAAKTRQIVADLATR